MGLVIGIALHTIRRLESLSKLELTRSAARSTVFAGCSINRICPSILKESSFLRDSDSIMVQQILKTILSMLISAQLLLLVRLPILTTLILIDKWAKKLPGQASAFVYSLFYVYFEQYTYIKGVAFQNLMLACGAVFAAVVVLLSNYRHRYYFYTIRRLKTPILLFLCSSARSFRRST